MITFKTISIFRKRLQTLLDYRRGVYGGVREEIIGAFRDIPIEQIRQNRDMILLQDDAIVIKLRLPDHRQRQSKANGYRLIYMVSMVEDRVAFLDIYPKRGPMQQLDISTDDLLELLSQYVDEGDREMLEDFEMYESNRD